jgi:hypothetical protein
VVFHSDHGEFLGEHGAIEKWDAAFYDCLTHVPFLVRLRYKLVFHLNGEHEFYDLHEDPGELDNLWVKEEVQAEVREMERMLLRRLIEADDTLPVSPNPRA